MVAVGLRMKGVPPCPNQGHWQHVKEDKALSGARSGSILTFRVESGPSFTQHSGVIYGTEEQGGGCGLGPLILASACRVGSVSGEPIPQICGWRTGGAGRSAVVDGLLPPRALSLSVPLPARGPMAFWTALLPRPASALSWSPQSLRRRHRARGQLPSSKHSRRLPVRSFIS